MKEKKIITCILCVVLSFGAFSGCTQREKDTQKEMYGESENEIYYYEKTNTKKTQIVIGVAENDDIADLVNFFAEKHPDIQPLICYMQKGDASYSPAAEQIRRGYSPDIVYNVDFGSENEKYYEDLSGKTSTGYYYEDALGLNDSNGHIYCLPGPSKVMAVAYNKTLFDKYGWDIPVSFDDFLVLCDKITSDTNGEVTPYNPNGKYATDFTGGLEAFAYKELFAGVDNQFWYKNFLNNKASFKGHMEPYFDMIRKMSEKNIIRAEDYNYSYTTRTKEFLSGKIAMINVFTDFDMENDFGYTFEFMPFPTTKGDEQYLSTRQSFNLSVVKKNRSQKQSDAVNAYLDFIATPEAQELCMGDGLMISNVKNVPIPDIPGISGIKKEILSGSYFRRIDFVGGKVPDSLNILNELRESSFDMIKNKESVFDVVSSFDSKVKTSMQSPSVSPAPEICGKANKDFTILETSEYIADVFRRRTNADIALIPNNSVFRGNLHRIYEGDIAVTTIKQMTPRSLDNKSSLVLTKMSGENLLKALNDPPDYSDGISNCIYAASGLKIKVAPANPIGEKYLSVNMNGGEEIEPSKMYRVAFWQGMIADKYIAETLQTYTDNYSALLIDAIKEDKTIYPPDDGRISVTWDNKK